MLRLALQVLLSSLVDLTSQSLDLCVKDLTSFLEWFCFLQPVLYHSLSLLPSLLAINSCHLLLHHYNTSEAILADLVEPHSLSIMENLTPLVPLSRLADLLSQLFLTPNYYINPLYSIIEALASLGILFLSSIPKKELSCYTPAFLCATRWSFFAFYLMWPPSLLRSYRTTSQLPRSSIISRYSFLCVGIAHPRDRGNCRSSPVWNGEADRWYT